MDQTAKATAIALLATLVGVAIPGLLCYTYIPADAVSLPAVALLFAPSGMWFGLPLGLLVAGYRKAACLLLVVLLALAAMWTVFWLLPLAWQVTQYYQFPNPQEPMAR